MVKISRFEKSVLAMLLADDKETARCTIACLEL